MFEVLDTFGLGEEIGWGWVDRRKWFVDSGQIDSATPAVHLPLPERVFSVFCNPFVFGAVH